MPASMPPPRAVLFDLDGTLVDSVAVIVDSYRHTLRSFGIRGVDEARIRSWIGMSLDETFAGLSAAHAAAMVRTYREHNLAHHDGRVSAYPGSARLVADLQTQGRLVAVVTSKGRELAARGLALTGVPAPAVLVGKEDTLRHKPHPEPLLRALELLGAEAAEAVYIGDAATDLRAAHAAGITAIGVTWGAGSREDLAAEAPSALVDDMDELAVLLAAGSASGSSSAPASPVAEELSAVREDAPARPPAPPCP